MSEGSFQSSYVCPECGKPLSKAVGMGDLPAVTLWCGYGPCKSQACEAGGDGDTEREAYNVINAAWGREME